MRWKTFHHFFLDDVFVLLAWTLNLASTILQHFAGSALFDITNVASGWLSTAKGPEMVPLLNTSYYHRALVATILLSFTSLWFIKLSFLVFFRRITVTACSRARDIHWWAVFVLTLASYIACIADQPYGCAYQDTVGRCTHATTLSEALRILGINTALDVLTDVLSEWIPWLLALHKADAS